MCGIGGFFGNFQPSLLEDIQQRMAHRGPDGFGIWKDGKAGVGLAHRRLSIIDLSTAASQPMRAVGGRYTIVFNGEIYNFKELASELKAKGYEFNENSDTAVLCPLYDAYGPEMLDRLEGMFAFAIWDGARRELFVARDHAGIKPLYYALTPKGLVFASEMKALHGIEGLDLTPDARAMGEYLTYLWTPGERTMVNGIRKLKPGHWMLAKNAGKGRGVKLEMARWYMPPLPPIVDGIPVYDASRTPQELLNLFDFVVREQCVADVPLGAFLSGGVDSSAIVASMCEQGLKPRKAYCIGFEGVGMAGEGFSEDIDFARDFAKHHKVMLNEVRVDALGILGRLPALAALLDEPTADPAPLFVEDIARQARADGIKVLMSGTGGDDIMTGYRRHTTARMREYMGPLRVLAAIGSGFAARFVQGSTRRRAQRLAGLFAADDERFLRLAFSTNSQPYAWTLLRPEFREEISRGWVNALDEAAEASRGHTLVNRVLFAELFGFLPDHNLNYGDKASMAAGVEVRVPFTDRRLLSFMAGVDPAMKMHGLREKAFFKESQRGRIPESILNRSKTGFGAPIRSWLVGPGKKAVEDALFADISGTVLDRVAVQNFWQKTQRGEVDGAYTVLAMCMMVWWLEAFRPECRG